MCVCVCFSIKGNKTPLCAFKTKDQLIFPALCIKPILKWPFLLTDSISSFTPSNKVCGSEMLGNMT